jgi:hypothetical protein
MSARLAVLVETFFILVGRALLLFYDVIGPISESH